MSPPAPRRVRCAPGPGPRHSPEWYDQRDDPYPLSPGDRLLVPCEGGPCTSRLEAFPPRLEIQETDGLYVLDDRGPRAGWRYVFVPRDGDQRRSR